MVSTHVALPTLQMKKVMTGNEIESFRQARNYT